MIALFIWHQKWLSSYNLLTKMRHYLLLFAVLCLLFMSCSIEKRQYRNGFYVDFHRTKNAHFVPGKNEIITAVAPQVENENACGAITPAVADTLIAVEFTNTSPENKIECNQDSAIAEGQSESLQQIPRDEVPPDQDRPNKKLFWMMLTAVVLAACAAGVLFPPVSIVFFILPVIGLLLFIAALYYRRRVLRMLIAGGTGEEVQLSKFYPNFALALYLFFGAVAATFIGIALVGSVVGIIGVILFEGGMIVGGAALLLLVLLSIIWLCKWRKQGEGRKKPWEPRPKDP